ncbi:transmembrane emp24 domain-containing protein 3-like [Narcine bancroftii]|uniref:transmembrane emp24 domain-containing protein 3-like n=1 Tax=Narcine bancroftii TaxID=1343680 RepID=UPI0038315776
MRWAERLLAEAVAFSGRGNGWRAEGFPRVLVPWWEEPVLFGATFGDTPRPLSRGIQRWPRRLLQVPPGAMATPRALLLLLLPCWSCQAFVRLVFELADKDVQCFFEEMEKGSDYTFLFKVVGGGHYDVDCFIEDPKGQMIYRKHKIHKEDFHKKAELSGDYKFCFGNQFSSFTHKVVFFHLQVDKMSPVVPGKTSPLTQLESSCNNIHRALKKVASLQSQQRLYALVDWLHASSINTHISYWAASETIILFLVTVGQVIVLKKLFTERKAI